MNKTKIAQQQLVGPTFNIHPVDTIELDRGEQKILENMLAWTPNRRFLDTGLPPHHRRAERWKSHSSGRRSLFSAFEFANTEQQAAMNPFRTAVPLWGRTSQIPSNLFPKRDCRRPRRDINPCSIACSPRSGDKKPVKFWVSCSQKRDGIPIRVEVFPERCRRRETRKPSFRICAMLDFQRC